MGTKNLIVYGAGSVAQLFLHEYGRGGYGGEYRIVGLLSDYGSKEAGAELEGYRILGSRKDLARIAQEHGVEDLVMGFAGSNPGQRLAVCGELERRGYRFPSFGDGIPSAALGAGALIDPTTKLIGTPARIGDFAVIGPFCTLETGARIGNGALLSPYVFVGMDASIGERSRLYVRASILPRVSVGEGCVVGPHELVRKDLPAQQALVDGKRFAARKLSSARE